MVRNIGILAGCVLVGSLVLVGLMPCRGAMPTDEAMASRYAPVLYFEADETCYPVNVSYYVPQTKLYGPSGLVDAAPTLTSIGGYGSADYYLDNTLGTVADNNIIDAYSAHRASLGYTVYAHVTSITDAVVIQYWFFYVFNPGELNRHEGDWEMAQVVVQYGTPTMAMFSQHEQGQRAPWSMVEHDGDHMKVYVARGSHASYFRSFSGKLGIASDYVGDNGLVLQPSSYRIEMLRNQSWLSFGGSWGWAGGNQSTSVQASVLGEAGPQGPRFRENGVMWQDPAGWGNGLPEVQQLLFAGEWVIYNFLLFFVVGTLVSVAVLGAVIVRRSRRTGLGPRVLSLFYIDGVNVKSIGNLLCIIGLVLTVLSVFYPWYVMSGVFTGGGQSVAIDDLLVVDAFHGVRADFPSAQGPVPLGTLMVPFGYIVLIGSVLLVVGTAGIQQSHRLGVRYIGRGVRLLLPFILIVVFVLMIGRLASMVPLSVPELRAPVQGTLDAMSRAPFQGTHALALSEPAGSTMQVSWSMGWGAYLLLYAAVVFFVAGIFELVAAVELFPAREPLPPVDGSGME